MNQFSSQVRSRLYRRNVKGCKTLPEPGFEPDASGFPVSVSLLFCVSQIHLNLFVLVLCRFFYRATIQWAISTSQFRFPEISDGLRIKSDNAFELKRYCIWLE